MDEIEKQVGRSINISAVHSVLTRLEEKGLLKSKMGDPTEERGGRRKRIFLLTAAGKRALEEAKAKELRHQLYNQIPKMMWQFNHLVVRYYIDVRCSKNGNVQEMNYVCH